MPSTLPSLSDRYDLLVVGGGINGVGIARDAVGRGLRVLLVERDDFASHTSSASTKLIHGGLRYLEYYEFRLVREALQERERLIRIAPQITRPLHFVLPQGKGGRPGWMIRTGLWLYDHLGGRQSLPRSHAVRLTDPHWGEGLKPGLSDGFVYSDVQVDDARLVVLNALDAAERGATLLTGVTLRAARPVGEYWEADLAPTAGRAHPALAGPTRVQARAMVNAAGPWVDTVLGQVADTRHEGHIRLVKGSHILVPRHYPGDHAFILQAGDGRIVFTIPWHGHTLIGTTDLLVDESERDHPEASPEERAYLCAVVNGYFARAIGPADIVASYSGVRPLYDDGATAAQAVTRDYVLKLGRAHGPQILSVFGGKLTTYRRLAEHALAKLAPFLPATGPDWTDNAPLPGGDLGDSGIAGFIATVRARWPFLPAAVAERMACAYGTRIATLLGTATNWADLGEDFGNGLTAAEVAYLVRHEWAREADDILWRRSKLGLGSDPQRLQNYLETSLASLLDL